MSRDVGAPPSLDFAEAMTSRYSTEPEPGAAPPPARPAHSASGPERTRRSWLLPVDVANEFAAAAARIHHASGGAVSKSDAQAALLRAAIASEDQVARELIGHGTKSHGSHQ